MRTIVGHLFIILLSISWTLAKFPNSPNVEEISTKLSSTYSCLEKTFYELLPSYLSPLPICSQDLCDEVCINSGYDVPKTLLWVFGLVIVLGTIGRCPCCCACRKNNRVISSSPTAPPMSLWLPIHDQTGPFFGQGQPTYDPPSPYFDLHSSRPSH